MTRTGRLKGCYPRVLRLFLIIAVILLVVGSFVYQRLGGVQGAQYWMAECALNRVEEHFLRNRSGGVSEEKVRSQFDRVRRANTNRETNLHRLYKVLKAYQTAFQRTKPSTQENIEFLSHLESAILLEVNE